MQKFIIGNDIGSGDGLIDLCEELPRRRRIELDVALEIELSVVRIGSIVVSDRAGLARGALEKQRGGGAADEARSLSENLDPSRWVQRSIVDVADKR
ncbi:MAG TPA: hypothetical protein VKE42_01880 [Candidatus Cybelea sp.]|nr:hypothetical protein [Candidatus Cybelea sp.]